MRTATVPLPTATPNPSPPAPTPPRACNAACPRRAAHRLRWKRSTWRWMAGRGSCRAAPSMNCAAPRWRACSRSARPCTPGQCRRWSWLRCRSALCRPIGPSVPGSRAGIRCRNRHSPVSKRSSCPSRRQTASPVRGAARPSSNCPASCSARWKRTPPAALRRRRRPGSRATRRATSPTCGCAAACRSPAVSA